MQTINHQLICGMYILQVKFPFLTYFERLGLSILKYHLGDGFETSVMYGELDLFELNEYFDDINFKRHWMLVENAEIRELSWKIYNQKI